jgi:hypothetical protein
MAERLHIAPGDEVFVVETENGILITPTTRTSRRPWRPTNAQPPNTATPFES